MKKCLENVKTSKNILQGGYYLNPKHKNLIFFSPLAFQPGLPPLCILKLLPPPLNLRRDICQNLKITEYFRLEETSRGHLDQPSLKAWSALKSNFKWQVINNLEATSRLHKCSLHGNTPSA